jgi:hypothetical protein
MRHGATCRPTRRENRAVGEHVNNVRFAEVIQRAAALPKALATAVPGGVYDAGVRWWVATIGSALVADLRVGGCCRTGKRNQTQAEGVSRHS